MTKLINLENKHPLRWQYISQGQNPWMHLLYIQIALEAGASWIQLRLKNQPRQVVLAVGSLVASLCREYGALFILNDHLELVTAVKADGVHLGLSDASIPNARKLLGEKAIIGGTANTAADLQARMNDQVDYIGLGPFRYTKTKEKLSPILGIAGYERLLKTNKLIRESHVPIYAIGGIGLKDIAPLLGVGVNGVAVSGLISPEISPASINAFLAVDLDSLTLKRWQRVYSDWKSEKGNAATIYAVQDKIASIKKALEHQ